MYNIKTHLTCFFRIQLTEDKETEDEPIIIDDIILPDDIGNVNNI